MTDTRIQFFDEPHVMQPGAVADYLLDFAAHLEGQGYKSLSISNYLWLALHFEDGPMQTESHSRQSRTKPS